MVGQQLKEHLTQLFPEEKTSEPLDNYSHIELTPEETAEALRLAREKVFFRLREEEYRKKLSAPRTYPKFNSGELMQFFKMQYVVDASNEKIVMDLCYYFSGDPLFSGDLKKGLLLSGGVGVGKTSLMQFFSRNQIFSYRMMSCREIEKHFSESGYEAVDLYSSNLPISTNGNPFGHQIIGYCFDDLGTEDNSKFYGKEKNMMAEIILNRYDTKLPFNSTHITTNLTAKDIVEQYGTRVTDRLKEMMNIIAFSKDIKSRR
jgi:DNA replication protein DnaC